ncbi:hypothetical protein F4804DRAFT_282002 [Jackrogersella minutella]|nr:hypothetical protein F4804DRAFT_282002 [Jackrogersella minutella]
MSSSIETNCHIVVAGDVPIDLFVYPTANSNSTQSDRQTSQVHRSNSGAALIGKFLDDSANQHHHHIHWPLHTLHGREWSLEENASTITELEIVAVDNEDVATFKVSRRQQLKTNPRWQRPQLELKGTDKINIMVFQDAEFEFANPDEAIDFFHKTRPKLLVYHMARPLGTGTIWDAARSGPHDSKHSPHPEDLLVVVDADDLRAEGVELSYGLSWEKTCEDFVEKIGSNGKLDTLVTCANLVVLFGCDAVIYHRGRQMAQPILIFDPLRTEGSFTRQHLGNLPGLIETFIGGLVTFIGSKMTDRAQIPREDLVDGIKFGMGTMRRFAELGFKNGKTHNWPRYPYADMRRGRFSADALITFTIPSETISSRSQISNGKWSILHDNIGDPVQVAHHIVRRGTLSAADWIPVAQFGDLIVLDRSEIESFRSIFHTVREYLSVQKARPLNIGVFGSRGSGKSFAAVQVVKAAATSCGRTIRQLRFNLAQFLSAEVFSAAFDAVRECALSGALAIVYINGFDTEIDGVQLGWLVHLLLPMHVGQVLDRGEMHHIGPAILLFGSNTTSSFEEFRKVTIEDADNIQRAQEFLSCLDAYVNVIGIDKVDESDGMFPVRRAAVLRALLEEREPKLQGADGLSIDDSVLGGLLMVPRFRHGIRSLRTIISTSKVTGKSHFEKGALPPMAQLHLHLDYDKFLNYSEGNILSDDMREHMARGLQETYIECRRTMAKAEAEKKALEKDRALLPWDLLDEEFKESTRAHVNDVPRKLRLIFYYLAKTDSSRIAVTEFEDNEVELLAQEEHERWNAERLSKQWHLGQREPEKRSSPFLVPWRDLTKEWQDVDRALVRSYPSILPRGYCIYRATKLTRTEKEVPRRLLHVSSA